MAVSASRPGTFWAWLRGHGVVGRAPSVSSTRSGICLGISQLRSKTWPACKLNLQSGMTLLRVVRAAGLVLLSAVALPFGPESGSAAEPDAIVLPKPGAERPSREGEQPSHVVLQGPGKPAGDLSRDFVVLAGPDGRAPRAWLWDEPLGCPR